MSPHKTTEDLKRYLKKKFEQNYKTLWDKVPEKEKKKKDLTQAKARIHKNAVKETEKDPKAKLYVQRLGDLAEIKVLEKLRIALDGIPSLVLRGVKTFHDFPKTLEKAGIRFSSRNEHDIIVIAP